MYANCIYAPFVYSFSTKCIPNVGLMTKRYSVKLKESSPARKAFNLSRTSTLRLRRRKVLQVRKLRCGFVIANHLLGFDFTPK